MINKSDRKKKYILRKKEGEKDVRKLFNLFSDKYTDQTTHSYVEKNTHTIKLWLMIGWIRNDTFLSVQWHSETLRKPVTFCRQRILARMRNFCSKRLVFFFFFSHFCCFHRVNKLVARRKHARENDFFKHLNFLNSSNMDS